MLPPLLGLTGTYGLYLTLSITSSPGGRSAVWIVVFAALWVLVRLGLRVPERRVQKWALGTGALFAIMQVLGSQLIATRDKAHLVSGVREALEVGVAVVGMAVALWAVLAVLLSWAGHTRLASDRGWRYFQGDIRSFLTVWAAIVIVWVPYLIVMFPTIMTPDSVWQVQQALGEAPLTNHHPAIHTGLIGLCLWIGKAFGSWTVGLAIYSVIQLLVMAAIFSAVLWYLARRQVHWALRLAVLAYLAILPTNALFAITMWKDIIFGGATLLLFVGLYEMARRPTAIWGHRGRTVGLIALLVLLATFRSNGLYALVLFAPFFLWSQRRHLKRAVAVCVLVAVLFGLYSMLVFNVLGIRQTEAREPLALPIQQIARVVAFDGNQITAKERADIGQYLPVDELAELYRPSSSDPVKARFNSDRFTAAPGEFLALYAKLGAQHPVTYLRAFVSLNLGYWYPDSSRWIAYYSPGSKAASVWPEIGKPSTTRSALGHDVKAVQTTLAKMPVVSTLYSIGFAMWALAVAGIVLVLKRRRRLLLPFMLLGMLWLTILASPVSGEYRYLYGPIVATPVAIVLALRESRVDRSTHDSTNVLRS